MSARPTEPADARGAEEPHQGGPPLSMLPLQELQPRSAASCQGLPQVPVEVCWNILGHRHAVWAVDAEGLSWDRFGFSVHEGVRVVMDAFQAGETKIATVEYLRGIHLGPHAVVQVESLAIDAPSMHF